MVSTSAALEATDPSVEEMRSAMDLLSGTSGSIMLLETPDDLVAGLARGNDVAVGRTDPTRFPGLTRREQEVMSALSVPLVSRDKFFGVLNVNAGPENRYSTYDLQAASLFAEQVAGAIANARLYETERMNALQAELGREFGTLHASAHSEA